MRRLSVIVVIGVCSLLMSAAATRASSPGKFVTSYDCTDKGGDPRWSAVTEITRKDPLTGVYVMTERGEGEYYGFEGPVSWVAELEFESTDDIIRPLKMERKVTDSAERTLAEYEQVFDHAEHRVRCVFSDGTTGKHREKAYKVDKDTVNRMILGLYIQRLLESGSRRARVQMIGEGPNLYDMIIRVERTEEITVNGTTRKAYRLCLDPELGVLSFVKVVLPKAYVWHSSDPDFEWLRYEGPESSVSSPLVRIDTAEPR